MMDEKKQIEIVIYKEDDLSKFKLFEYNRIVDSKHVERLKRSISSNNDLHLNPIIVDDEFNVVDGQHRLFAARELNIPIYYLIDNEFKPDKMISLNVVQKCWTYYDYMNYWSNSGVEDYEKIKQLCESCGFTVSIVLDWLNIGGKTLNEFRMGKFQYNPSENIKNAMFLTKKLLSYLNSLNIKTNKFSNQRPFHRSCRFFFCHPLVDNSRFFGRLKFVYNKLNYCLTWQQYAEIFVDIYNYGMKTDKLKIVMDGIKRDLTL